MTNARGNRYSRNHTHLNPDKDADFWNFSFHEVGTCDLPSTIDYIIHVTKENCVYYVGHGYGATAMYIMTSELPQYNQKVKLYASLAPAVYMTHQKSPFYKYMAYVLKTIGVRTIHFCIC